MTVADAETIVKPLSGMTVCETTVGDVSWETEYSDVDGSTAREEATWLEITVVTPSDTTIDLL